MISTHKRMKMYCKDDLSKIENYEKAVNDNKNIWVLHHRLELTLEGEFAHTQAELIRMNMYYHRPAFELIFIKDEDHKRMHGKFHKMSKQGIQAVKRKNTGKKRTLAQRKLISERTKIGMKKKRLLI